MEQGKRKQQREDSEKIALIGLIGLGTTILGIIFIISSKIYKQIILEKIIAL